jgi:hypothetical protein
MECLLFAGGQSAGPVANIPLMLVCTGRSPKLRHEAQFSHDALRQAGAPLACEGKRIEEDRTNAFVDVPSQQDASAVKSGSHRLGLDFQQFSGVFDRQALYHSRNKYEAEIIGK